MDKSNAATGTIVQTLEQRITTDLQRFDSLDIDRGYLQAMKETAEGLQLKGLDDHETIEQAKAMKKELTGKRTAVEKLRKELKADALEYGRRLDGFANELKAAIEAVEALPAAILDEAERLKTEEQNRLLKAEADKLESRQRTLFDLGIAWNGQHYAAPWERGPITMDTVRQSREAEWMALVELLKEEAKAWQEELERREAERVEQARKAEELAAKEAELKEREERLAREEAERRTRIGMERGQDAARISSIYGQPEGGEEGFVLLQPTSENSPALVIEYTPQELAGLEPKAWEELLDGHRVACERLAEEAQRLKEAEEAARALDALELQRVNELKALGAGFDSMGQQLSLNASGTDVEPLRIFGEDLRTMPEEEWARVLAAWKGNADDITAAKEARIRAEERERLAKEEADRKAEEAARLAAASDRERFEAWAEQVRGLAPKATGEDAEAFGTPAMSWAVQHVLDALAEGESHIAEAAGE